VAVVERPGQHAGARADAAVTAVPGSALGVLAADCAPVVLLGEEAVGVAHVGWRGLVAGVVATTVEALGRLRPGPVRAVIGPCIRPPCYAFSPGDLEVVAATVGDGVRASTLDGRPALDLPGGVRAALAAAGVEDCDDTDVCTACSSHHWSHRRDASAERQALVAWLDR
jgi:copper oxidase (laccase) domain-containing protein